MLRLWRWLFVALLLITCVLALHTAQNLNIDTNLADVSPTAGSSPGTKAAVDKLKTSIEQRILLLIQGDDEDLALDAEEALRERLANIRGITVQPDAFTLLETLVEKLTPFRFSLLSEQQRQTAQQQSPARIAEQAQAELYGLSSSAGLYSFDQDPLGWHNQTIFDLLNAPGSGFRLANDQAAVINLTIDENAMNMRTQERLSNALRKAITEVQSEFGVSIERSGVFFFAAHAADSAKQDVSLISTGSIIGVVILLLFAFRSLRALLLPAISIGLGVAFAFVATHSWYGNVHVLTIVFGASLIGIVIDYSLHFLYHGADTHNNETKGKTRSALHRALLLSLMTSLIGYAALSFSDLQALRKVAVFSCCGLFMAWLSVVCLGDLVLRKPLYRNQSVFPHLVTALTAPIKWLPRKVWAGLVLAFIGIAAALLIGKPNFSDDPRAFYTLAPELLASERKVAEVANDYEPGRYIIINGANNAEVYQRYQALLNSIAAAESLQTQDLTSLLAWVPTSQVQKENYQLQAKLYASDGAAELLAKSLAGSETAVQSVRQAYGEAANRLLTPDQVTQMLGAAMPPFWFRDASAEHPSVTNFVLLRKGANTGQLATLTAPLDGVEYVNNLERTRDALGQQRVSASQLLLLAYLLVAGLLLLRYRQLNSLWLLALPITASAMLVLLSTLLGFGLNLFHVMALFLVLGFGMDYAIFVREMNHQLNITLQAIFLSAATSLLSFGLLSISSIPVVASFGITLLIGNLFNLLGAFVYAQCTTKPATGRQ